MALPEAVTHIDWQLSSLQGVRVVGGHRPTLRFDTATGRIAGFSGCNNYSASYSISDSRLSIGPIAATRMACGAAAMSIEDVFNAALARVTYWQLQEGQLTLGHGNNVLMTLTAASNKQTAVFPGTFEFHSKVADKSVAVINSKHTEPVVPGSASMLTIRVTPHSTVFDAHGQLIGLAILTTSSGGSGTFYEMALLVKRDGKWINTDTVILGDRIKIKDLSVENGNVTVDALVHAKGEPMCCPSISQRFRYRIEQGHL